MDASDESKVKTRKDLAKDRLKQAKLDRKAVMSTPEGRRFVWDLLGQTGLLIAAYNPDVNRMVFDAGVRSLGVRIYDELTTEIPELFLQMQEEALRKTKEEEVYG